MANKTIEKIESILETAQMELQENAKKEDTKLTKVPEPSEAEAEAAKSNPSTGSGAFPDNTPSPTDQLQDAIEAVTESEEILTLVPKGLLGL